MSNSKFKIYDINIDNNNKITENNLSIYIGNVQDTKLTRDVCKVLITCEQATKLKTALDNKISVFAINHKKMMLLLKSVSIYLSEYNLIRQQINTLKNTNRTITDIYKLKIFYNENRLKEFYIKLNKNINKIRNYHNRIFKLEQLIRRNKDIDLRDKNISVHFYYYGKENNSLYHEGIIKKININQKLFYVEYPGTILDTIRNLGKLKKFNFKNLCVIKDEDGIKETTYHRDIFNHKRYNSMCNQTLQ